MQNHEERLQSSESRYEELNLLMMDPDVLSDQARYLKIVQEHSELEPLVADVRRSRALRAEMAENQVLFTESDDQEFRGLIREELAIQAQELEEIEQRLFLAIQPRDPNDDKNVILEIRAGTGGEEAALFAADLLKAYAAYAEARGWPVELLDSNETEIGGFREVICNIDGKGAYSRLKFESGVHRVQRVPVTESGGRVHTSTVTVAVLPEAAEVELEINPSDLQIDTYRASGAGGQHVNKTSSAIRITHLPTGMVVTCQDQRSQHKNRDRAMAVLRSRLLEQEQSRQEAEVAEDRRSQVGSGARSERIRTYNYPQNRVTDHRIGLTLYQLDRILAGDLDVIITALQAADHEARQQRQI